MEDTPLVGIVFLWMIWSGGGFVVRCSCCSMPPSLIPQTLDAIVDMVDKMVVFIVRAAAGCPEFSSGPKSRLMVSVVMLVRFLLLVGGVACSLVSMPWLGLAGWIIGRMLRRVRIGRVRVVGLCV